MDGNKSSCLQTRLVVVSLELFVKHWTSSLMLDSPTRILIMANRLSQVAYWNLRAVS